MGFLTYLINRFQDNDIALMIAVLKTSGSTLQKEAPNAMKNLVSIIYRLASFKEHLSNRTRLMLDVVTAFRDKKKTIKDNNSAILTSRLTKLITHCNRTGKVFFTLTTWSSIL